MSSILQSMKISGSIEVGNAGSGTLYTVPANSYAILNLIITVAPVSIAVQIDGYPVLQTATAMTQAITVYVGPGQVLASTGSLAGAVYASGVLFTNT